MDRLRRAGTLSLGVCVGLSLTGCAGLHRHATSRGMTGGIAHRDGGAHSPADPFVPGPGQVVGLGRYFPGIGKPGANQAEPPAEEEVARSGFRLFKRHAHDPLDPEGGMPRPPRGQDPSTIEHAAAEPPTPTLPLALVAEVDPANLNPARAALVAAQAKKQAAGPAARDVDARRVQAGLDDVLPRVPEPQPPAPAESQPSPPELQAPAPSPTAGRDPFAEFDLQLPTDPAQKTEAQPSPTPAPTPAESPASPEPTPAPESPAVEAPPAPESTPTSPESTPTSPESAPAGSEPTPASPEPAPSEEAGPAATPAPDSGGEPNPFSDLELPTPPSDAELFGNAPADMAGFEPRPASDSSASPVLGPAGRPMTQRYGHSTVPISRRLAPPPEPDPADIYGRPRLPLVRPRQDGLSDEPPAPTRPDGPPPAPPMARHRPDGISASLPPVTFPPSYYEGQGEPQPHPAAVTPSEPPARKRWFSRPRLFRRWRGGDQPRPDEGAVVEPGLVGPEPDDIPQGR